VATLSNSRLEAIQVDVRDAEQTARSLRGAAVIINCTDYRFNVAVMKAALGAAAHYVDLGGLFHVTREQLKLDDDFKASGLTAVIGMGAAPGISNLLARHAADRLDSVHAIHIRVGSIDQTKYSFNSALPVSYSINTILEEFSLQPAVFTGGHMSFVAPMSGAERHSFPRPIGRQMPMYTLHSEIATLPESYREKGIQEVSFKIAFAPEFTARVKFLLEFGLGAKEPIQVNGQKIAPVDVVKALVEAQPKPTRIGPLKQYEVVRAVVKGTLRGKKVTHVVDCHTDGMPDWDIGLDIDTGSPPSIVAQMLARRTMTATGVLAPEKAVPAQPFFEALRLRKMRVTEAVKRGWVF
jgi:saccharopine dehydrogenase-like NADP-dependent oxidoreductase